MKSKYIIIVPATLFTLWTSFGLANASAEDVESANTTQPRMAQSWDQVHKDMHFDANGNPVDEDGNPIKMDEKMKMHHQKMQKLMHKMHKDMKFDANGNPVDKDGNPIQMDESMKAHHKDMYQLMHRDVVIPGDEIKDDEDKQEEARKELREKRKAALQKDYEARKDVKTAS